MTYRILVFMTTDDTQILIDLHEIRNCDISKSGPNAGLKAIGRIIHSYRDRADVHCIVESETRYNRDR